MRIRMYKACLINVPVTIFLFCLGICKQSMSLHTEATLLWMVLLYFTWLSPTDRMMICANVEKEVVVNVWMHPLFSRPSQSTGCSLRQCNYWSCGHGPGPQVSSFGNARWFKWIIRWSKPMQINDLNIYSYICAEISCLNMFSILRLCSVCRRSPAGLSPLLLSLLLTASTFPSWDRGEVSAKAVSLCFAYSQELWTAAAPRDFSALSPAGSWSTASLWWMRMETGWESLPMLPSRPLCRWWCPGSGWRCQPWVMATLSTVFIYLWV